MNKNAILVLLGDRPVAYHPLLAKALGSVEAAVWVSQLLYWTGKEADPEGWIYKTQAEWEDETGLSRRNQETARRNLGEEGKGVLEEALKQMPARLHYRLNLDKLADILSEILDRSPVCANRTNSAPLFARTVQTSMAEPAKQSIYTETTTSSSSNGQNPKNSVMTNLPQPPTLGEINKLWLENIGIIGPIQAEMIADLFDEYGGAEMDLAIKAAVTANARSMNYVQGTLKGRRNGSANRTTQQVTGPHSGRHTGQNGTGRATQPALSAEDAAIMAEWAAANT